MFKELLHQATHDIPKETFMDALPPEDRMNVQAIVERVQVGENVGGELVAIGGYVRAARAGKTNLQRKDIDLRIFAHRGINTSRVNDEFWIRIHGLYQLKEKLIVHAIGGGTKETAMVYMPGLTPIHIIPSSPQDCPFEDEIPLNRNLLLGNPFSLLTSF